VFGEGVPTGEGGAATLAVGTRLGPYEVMRLLGAGGMGEVYQARDRRLGRTVAIKVLPPDLAVDAERRRRFEQEARTVSALNHPHICTLHDIGEAELPSSEPRVPFDSAQGKPSTVRVSYLVMEYLDGETLAERLRRGALPLTQALDYGTQIADALAAAHKQGVIHRDLKPGNVMLTKDGAKLLDFGLAKVWTRGHVPVEISTPTLTGSLTRAGEILGTRPYMAPEQVEGKAIDTRTDLWALGCVLYEMVTGRQAFTGDSIASITAAILDREPEPMAASQPVTPQALERLVGRCLAKRADGRCHLADDVAQELRRIVRAGQTALGARRRWVLVSTITLVSLVIGGVAFWSWARRTQKDTLPHPRSRLGRRLLLSSSPCCHSAVWPATRCMPTWPMAPRKP